MPKNIIICCDGTGNEFGKNNTNVVKMFGLATKDDADKQIAYYAPGVGTGGWEYDENEQLRAKTDAATGGGLQKNINDAYQYLMRFYNSGDNIYLFGFSRGAFTVRSLAGMLHKCGLLASDLDNMLEYAAKMYNTADNDDIAGKFKKTFSRACPVHFIGVWDTVESLAMNAGKKFHNAKLNSEVGHGYHAVALDEVRDKFPPSLWEERDNVEQVWFAGMHSNVGGWYDETGLSDIALKWMAEKAKKHGMLLDESELEKITGDPMDVQHNSHTGFWKVIGRHIRELPAGAKVHSSVKQRLDQPVKVNDDGHLEDMAAYQPKAKMKEGGDFLPDKVEFVD